MTFFANIDATLALSKASATGTESVPESASGGFVAAKDTLFPDAQHAFLFVGFLICGALLGLTFRKIFRVFAHKKLLAGTPKALGERKIWARSLLETFAGTVLFLCLGLSVIAYRAIFAPAGSGEPTAEAFFARVFCVFLICAGTIFLWNLTRLPVSLIKRYSTKSNKSVATLLPLAEAAMKVFVVAFGILLILRVTINTQPAEILAMLGVGGLAIGLAAQDSVKNFFGSIMLIFDSPFQVGDLIDIDGTHTGTVEKVGVRSTRVRSTDGALHVLPNGDLANRPIRTLSARRTIRRDFTLNLTYDTAPEKLEKAIAIVRETLQDKRCIHDSSTPRAFFTTFSESSLDIQVTYFFAGTEYVEFLKFNHAVNMQILRRFNDAKIKFAYPTRTIYSK